MHWLQLLVSVPKAQADLYEEVLLTLGALSVTYQDAADQPLFEPAPGEMALWEAVQLLGLFHADAEEETLRAQWIAWFGDEEAPAVTFERLPEQQWERSWIAHFQPMQFGARLWIVPSHIEATFDGVMLHLDPGLAFGTGTHATTALCLEWLDGQTLNDKTLIDYGCGSGVLAIAALLLGARSALALDNDPQALQATEQNAEQNACAARLRMQLVATQGQEIQEQADIVIANILAGPLATLAPVIAPLVKAGGTLVLSGILQTQAQSVMDAYHALFEFEEPAVREDWVRLVGHRRGVSALAGKASAGNTSEHACHTRPP